jgi:hypothetical protein
MTPDDSIPTLGEMSLLVSALVDGYLDDEGYRRLSALIESDEEARVLYIRLIHQHADLSELAFDEVGQAVAAANLGDEFYGNATDPAETWPPVRALIPTIATMSRRVLQIARRPIPLSLTAAVLVVGIFVCGMAFVAVPLYRQSSQRPEVTERLAVAKITRLHEPQWAAEEGRRASDQVLVAGDRIDLSRGFAEILFYNGAAVILQGPCLFQVSSSGSGRLDEGRLTAVVPRKAAGFSIRSPCMNVVDLGTEFGVLVEDDGATKVDVFSGRVEVAWLDAAELVAQRMTLGAGEAARVSTASSGIEKVEPSSAKFVRAKVLNELVAEHAFRRWQAFAASLEVDPGVVAFYDFMRRERSPELLPNVIQPGVLDGEIDGPAWTTGRWQEKQALRFDQLDESVRLDFSGASYEQLSLSTWVAVDRLARPHTCLFYSQAWDREGATHWSILADGRIEFALFGNEPAVVQSDAAAMQRRSGRWVHLAVVYDARAKQVRFYVNGMSRGVRSYASALAADLQEVQIGNWDREARNMIGEMDELIVYRRALDDSEILHLFTQGRP